LRRTITGDVTVAGKSATVNTSWPKETRERALQVAATEGLFQASAETGVQIGTLKAWRSRLARRAAVVAVTAGRSCPVRRERTVTDFANAMDRTRVALVSELEAGSSGAVKDLAIALGIVVEKTVLLSGEATSRTETVGVHIDAGRQAEQLLESVGARTVGELAAGVDGAP
jgi:hypothetical protein